MMMKMKSSLAYGATAALFASSVFAQELERVGKPTQDGMWFQPAVGEKAQMAQALNTGLIYLCIAISLFVVVLLGIVIVKFRDTGKEPKRFTHNSMLEIAWTLVPVLVLVVLSIFSVPALLAQVTHPKADLVIKVTGNQWYWNYEYPEEGIVFDSIMLTREELAEYGYQDDEYLLAVDNAVVVPVNANVTVQMTAMQVIHSWKIPSLYVMADAVPGRTTIQSFKADKVGMYFGQCSELCGKNHAYMPIVLKVLSEEDYAEWLKGAKEEFAMAPARTQLAQLDQ